MYDSTLACVICDDPVLINSQVLQTTSSAAALCDDCDSLYPWSLLQIIWKLRCQLAEIMSRLS